MEYVFADTEAILPQIMAYQLRSFGDVGGLRGFIYAPNHNEQYAAALDVVHTPTRPEMFTCLENALAYRLDVAQRSQLGLFQPMNQVPLGQSIPEAANPSGK